MAVVHTRNRKRLHEEVKNFVLECDICERQFVNTSQLKIHFKTVHSINNKNIDVESKQEIPRSLRRKMCTMLKTKMDFDLENKIIPPEVEVIKIVTNDNKVEKIKSVHDDISYYKNDDIPLEKIITKKDIEIDVRSSFNTGCPLNVRTILEKGSSVIQKASNLASMDIRNPYIFSFIKSSGKVMCAGADSEKNSLIGARRIGRKLQKLLGFKSGFFNYHIMYVMGTVSLPFSIDILKFFEDNDSCHDEKYDSNVMMKMKNEPAPVVEYKMKSPKIILMIFASGHIFAKGQNEYDVQDSVIKIISLLKKHKKAKDLDVDDQDIISKLKIGFSKTQKICKQKQNFIKTKNMEKAISKSCIGTKKRMLISHEIKFVTKIIHEEKEKEKQPITCDKCNKIFADKSNQRRHCNLCHKDLGSSWNSIKSHKRFCGGVHEIKNVTKMVHEDRKKEKPPLTCDKCNKTFADKSHLRRHCNLCHKDLGSSWNNIKSHKRFCGGAVINN